MRDAAVLTLNRDYVFDGMRLDLDALFTPHPVFDEASALRAARSRAALLGVSARKATRP